MHYKYIRALARDMRRNPTPAERFFWERVRNKQLLGKKFNRQFIIQCSPDASHDRFVIVDFHCHEHRLIVEVDGAIHNSKRVEDGQRQHRLEEMGFQVVKFKNAEVLNDWEQVADRLVALLTRP